MVLSTMGDQLSHHSRPNRQINQVLAEDTMTDLAHVCPLETALLGRGAGCFRQG